MATQTVGNVHVNVPLSNLAVLYSPAAEGFVAERVAPRVPVAKESDKYYIFDKGPWFGAGDDVDLDLKADRAPVKRVEVAHSLGEYFCEERALGFDISPRERANADSILKLETNKQRNVLLRLALLRERRVAAKLLDSDTAGGGLDSDADTASAARWDAAATTYANIRADIIAAIQAVRAKIGRNPNTIVIPLKAAEGLTATKFYSDLVKWNLGSGERPQLTAYTEDLLLPSQLFGLNVVVAGAMYDTAVEDGTFSASEIWGEVARVLYVESGPSLEAPSVMYTMESRPRSTRQWHEDDPELDVYEVGNGVIDEKVVGSGGAATISNLLT